MDWSGPFGIAVGRSLNPGAAIPAVSVDPDVPAAAAPDSLIESMVGSDGPTDSEICAVDWRRRALVAPVASIALSEYAWRRRVDPEELISD